MAKSINIKLFGFLFGTGALFGILFWIFVFSYSNIKQDLEMCIELSHQNNVCPVARVTISNYNSVVAQTDSSPHSTAFNVKPGPGVIAISRDLLEKGFIPFSKVYIEGFGVFTVADLTHERHKNRIDIWTTENIKPFLEHDVLAVGYNRGCNENKGT
jgi:3D (Asp-Asp-Asp) domain-containing protein